MKKGYTLLIPTMLPMHFRMIISVLKTYGYKMELLETSGPEIAETGLRYVHNDTCYPAVLVIGQFITALESGHYDPHKVALVLFQTGGGCRASNYISLLRKALRRAGYEYVPVIAFSFAGIEKHPGFKTTIPQLHGMLYGILYADLMMWLYNQCRPYETHPGDAQRLCDRWTERLGRELGAGRAVSYRKVKKNYRRIIADFSAIEMKRRDAVKVGVVGEIFVKYSPLGNNHLEDFLISQGAEVVVPGLADFLLYCVYNNILDRRLFRRKSLFNYILCRIGFSLLCGKKNKLSRMISSESDFEPFPDFRDTVTLTEGYIHQEVKMGEGWLLTAEMLELTHSGVKNIVCTQPFGCLPNHVCGKGMMRLIKEKQPDVNIVAIDYDSGATQVNQQNRLRLLLANAQQ